MAEKEDTNSKDKKAEQKEAQAPKPQETKEKKPEEKKEDASKDRKIIDTYEFKSKQIPLTVTVAKIKGEFVPIYEVSISSISRTTEFILEKIRQELIKKVKHLLYQPNLPNKLENSNK